MHRRDVLTLGLASFASLAAPAPAFAAGGVLRPDPTRALPYVRARRADDICESYMVNTKLFYRDTVYGHTDAVVDLLQELGVRIVRERITTGTSTGTRNQQRAMLALAGSGTRWHATVGNLSDWRNADAVNRQVMSYLASYYKPRVGNLSNLLHSFGGCNEIDGFPRDPEWAAHARVMQKALWRSAKANSATAGIPVAGPSTRTDITAGRAAELGDLSEWSDVGNAHMYNKGSSPSRNIDEHISILSRCFPNAKQWIFTETGYNNSPQDNTGKTVPEFASASYAVRGICDFFQRNSVYGRFELLDDPDPIDYSSQASINRTADRNAHFGLVAMTERTIARATPDTWRKKPEFYSTKRFLSLLADRGPSFAPAPLQVRVSGGGADLRQTLVQKRDGRHYLLLWRDVDVAEHYPDGDRIPVRSQQLRVEMTPPRPVAVYVPRHGERPKRTYAATSSFPVYVGGDLVVVEIG